MADTFRPRFGRLGSIARMEPPPPSAPAAPAPTPAPPTTSTARPSTRPQLQPQPTGLFRGTASVPSSPILPAALAPSDITSAPPSVPTSPIPMATIITTTTGTYSLPQSPAKPSTAAAAGTSSLPQSPFKQLNGPTSGTSSLPQSPAKLPPAPAPLAPARAPLAPAPALLAPAPAPLAPAPALREPAPAPLAPPTRVQSPLMTKAPSPVKYSPKSFTRVAPSSSPPRSSPKKLVASPKAIKSTSPPPSPLRLPPSQITAYPEPEPTKRQLVSTPAPPPSPQHKAKVLPEHDKIMESTKVVHNKAQELPRHHSAIKPHSKSWASSDEESGLRMINIAGENRGAFMELLPSSASSTPGSPMKSKALHGEEAAKAKKDGKGGAGTLSPLSAFVNSNVQGVNNSILLNASCAHNSPGVHLAVTRRPSGKAKELAGVEAHHA